MLWRRDNHAEFLHYLERFPEHPARGVQSDGDERVGRGLHVLHLRLLAGVCLRQLRGAKATAAQRRLSAGRESRNTGKLNNNSIHTRQPRPQKKKKKTKS